jgi:hypothetical protein
MKISMMTNDQASEAMIRISTPMANILDDKNSKELIDSMADLARNSSTGAISALLPKFVSFCLKDHKADLYEIIGALTFKPASHVGKMNFMETIKEMRESIDEDFIGFFKSSGNATATPGEK